VQLGPEEKRELESVLADFEKFRKKKYRSYRVFTLLRKPFKIVYILAVPAAVLAAILPFLLPFFLPVILLGIGLFILETVLYNFVFKKPDEKFHHRFKTEIMPLAFQKINHRFHYFPDRKFSKQQVMNMSLFKEAISGYHGEDHVVGKVLDVDIEFCEASLYTERYSAGTVLRGVLANVLEGVIDSGGMGPDDNSNEFSKQVCFFKGLLLEVDFHKSFKGVVYAVPKHHVDAGLFKKSSFLGREKVSTGNVNFDQYYSVFASEEVLLHYVLTPAMLDKVLHLKEQLGAEIFLSLKHGKLHLGVNWGRDLFECDFKKGIPSIEDFIALARDVELFEFIVTSLSQERRIWGDKALS